MSKAAASSDTVGVCSQEMSESYWKKLETSTTIITSSLILTLLPSCNSGATMIFLTSLKLHKLLLEITTSPYLQTCERCSTFNPGAVSTPASPAQTDSVNSVYSYTDESDVFTPGCNMLFRNFY